MARLKFVNAQNKLQGGSLIEVIVASVLVLVCFLAFSIMMHTGYSSRPAVPELHLLYTMQLLNEGNAVDFSSRLRKNCSKCGVNYDNSSVIVRIHNSRPDLKFLQLYDDTVQVFQK